MDGHSALRALPPGSAEFRFAQTAPAKADAFGPAPTSACGLAAMPRARGGAPNAAAAPRPAAEHHPEIGSEIAANRLPKDGGAEVLP